MRYSSNDVARWGFRDGRQEYIVPGSSVSTDRYATRSIMEI